MVISKKEAMLLLLVSELMVSCTADKAAMPKPKKNSLCDSITFTFSGTVKPILMTNCATPYCHDKNAANGDLTNYAGVKNFIDNGSFSKRVISGTPSWMPPNGSLPEKEKNEIECWLNDGAMNN